MSARLIPVGDLIATPATVAEVIALATDDDPGWHVYHGLKAAAGSENEWVKLAALIACWRWGMRLPICEANFADVLEGERHARRH